MRCSHVNVLWMNREARPSGPSCSVQSSGKRTSQISAVASDRRDGRSACTRTGHSSLAVLQDHRPNSGQTQARQDNRQWTERKACARRLPRTALAHSRLLLIQRSSDPVLGRSGPHPSS